MRRYGKNITNKGVDDIYDAVKTSDRHEDDPRVISTKRKRRLRTIMDKKTRAGLKHDLYTQLNTEEDDY